MNNTHKMVNFLSERLGKIEQEHRLRQLKKIPAGGVDFCSNDYLGMVKHGVLQQHPSPSLPLGATGSRLISGHNDVIENTENFLAHFHQAEDALIFNSGYDANIGLFSSIPQKGDTVIYDEYIHASIRDGIRLSFAFSQMFQHNNLNDLERRLTKAQGHIYVAIETLYSMDGDIPPLSEIIFLCQKYGAHLIVDEAHAIGLYGVHGQGIMQQTESHHHCFARVYTFGKALGVHGAAVVGSKALKQVLINTARSLIYTTALPPQSIQHIQHAYQIMAEMNAERQQLFRLINFFKKQDLPFDTLNSHTHIQGIVVPNIQKLIDMAHYLHQHYFYVSPIRYPTVPQGQERLRISLHSFNTEGDIERFVNTIKNYGRT